LRRIRATFLIRLILLVLLAIGLAPSRADESLRLQRPLAGQAESNAPTPGDAQSVGNFQVKLAIPDNASGKQDTTKLQANVSQDAAQDENGLTQVDLQRLAAHDIVLLVDKSGSMSTPDCPSKGGGGAATVASIVVPLIAGGSPLSASRWSWCHAQTEKMARQTENVLPGGFSVVLFDSRFNVFPHVTVDGLADIFRNHHPGGGTDLAGPLDCVFRDYFTRKRLPGSSIKPLLVGVITDGCPNFPRPVHDVIIRATHSVSNPSEIIIVFFLIGGQDRTGEEFVRDITHNLVREGASYNIVRSVAFHDLKKIGLAKALAENL
jgi:Mg-chelatase subunit ChlD